MENAGFVSMNCAEPGKKQGGTGWGGRGREEADAQQHWETHTIRAVPISRPAPRTVMERTLAVEREHERGTRPAKNAPKNIAVLSASIHSNGSIATVSAA